MKLFVGKWKKAMIDRIVIDVKRNHKQPDTSVPLIVAFCLPGSILTVCTTSMFCRTLLTIPSEIGRNRRMRRFQSSYNPAKMHTKDNEQQWHSNASVKTVARITVERTLSEQNTVD